MKKYKVMIRNVDVVLALNLLLVLMLPQIVFVLFEASSLAAGLVIAAASVSLINLILYKNTRLSINNVKYTAAIILSLLAAGKRTPR